MSIRIKVLLGIGLTFAALFTLFNFTIVQYLSDNFQRIENGRVIDNTLRVRDALLQVLSNIDVKSSDWANWDDTYQFIEDQNPAYIKSNLPPLTPQSLDLHFMLFYNSGRQLVTSVAADLDSSLPTTVPTSLVSYLGNHPELFSIPPGTSLTGLISIPEGPLLFTSRPILTSDGSGPARGTLIFARYLDTTLTSRLAQVTHLDLTFLPHPPSAVISTPQILLQDTKKVTGQLSLTDHADKPILLLQVSLPRDIFAQSRSSLRYFTLAIFILGASVTLATAVILDIFVLRRLTHLTSATSNITSVQDLSARIPAGGSDELSRLASEINHLLERLDKSQSQTISIVSSMGDGLFVINRDDYRITLMNPKAGEILGLSPDQAIGHDAKDIIKIFQNDKSIPAQERPVARTFTTGQPTHIEPHEGYVIQSITGKSIPVSISTAPLTQAGRIYAAVVTFRDVTTEIQLTRSLQTQRDQAKAIVSSMGEGLLVIDSNRKITVINEAAEKLLGVKSAQVIDKPWSEVVTAAREDGSVISVSDRSFSQTLALSKSVFTPPEEGHYYLTPSGKKFPVAAITTPLIENGKAVGAIKVFRDVTHEKEEKAIIEAQVVARTRELNEKNLSLLAAQAKISQGWVQLQYEKARLTSSLNSLSLGFILTDPTENILIMNPAATRLLAISHTTNLKEIEKLLGPACPLHELHLKCQAQKAPVEVKDVGYNNRTFRLLLSPIISTTPRQEYIGTVILLEDTTEARILERSRDEFFSIASHELRTPLTAIRGNTSLIKQFYANQITNPEFTEMVTDIHDSSIRLIDIVNDFLNLSRLEQGRIEFKKTNLDLTELTKNVIKELSTTAAEKHLTLALRDPETPPLMVYADSDRVKEVLINLISNGLKFTNSGTVTVSLDHKDGFISTYIADTGRGIPLPQQNLLFHKFQQAGESLYTRDTTKGTGLGLYISKLIIENLGGKIWLEKSSPTGSIFCFILPASKT